jgi:hypothetical protein
LFPRAKKLRFEAVVGRDSQVQEVSPPEPESKAQMTINLSFAGQNKRSSASLTDPRA